MASQILPNLSADALREITFIAGFDQTGAVAGTSSNNYDATNKTYQNVSSSFKWGGGIPDGSGTPTGPNPTTGTTGGIITYAFAPGFSAAQTTMFAAAFQMWSNVANITFVFTTDANAADTGILINTDEKAFETANVGAQSPVGATRVSAEGGPYISVDVRPTAGFGNWANDYSDGGYSLATAVHEVGHLIGLGHGGPYNEGEGTGGGGAPASQFTPYDQTLYAIMSYVKPSDANATYVGSYDVRANWGTNASGAPVQAVTAMPLDILAAQRIYGAPTSGTLTQAQTFGFNTTITDPTRTFFDFSINTQPVVTLYDTASTGNVLDLSGFSSASVINLTPGSFSSTSGQTNNLGIAYGTVIGTVIGGAGNDRFSGTDGDEILRGGGGNDAEIGGAGFDLIYGNQGDDLIYGNGGSDVVFGGQGVDAIFGGQGSDTLAGGMGNDVLQGNLGNDIVYGNAGADVIYGNAGSDALFGGQSNDLLFGGQGNDTLAGGLGDDTLAGGVGADLYVFGANSGRDLILGFSQSQGDLLSLGGQTYTTADDGQGGTLLALSGGGTIDLAGVASGSITPSAFA